MKGLMLKDLYILKRNLLTCLTVTVGVILPGWNPVAADFADRMSFHDK